MVATRLILNEAELNIDKKLGQEALNRFYQELEKSDLMLAPLPSADERDRWSAIVAEKDAHVLAGAVTAKADVVVSLDRKHILTEAVRIHFPIPVQDTTAFLQNLAQEY